MKIRKLLVCALAAIMICEAASVSAYAAENQAAEIVTEEESTEESTNEDTITIEPGASTEDTEKSDKEASEETVTEETEESEEDAEEEAEEEKEDTKNSAAAYKEKKATYKKSELRLLASLIFCEAGSEPYAGKVAVGIVVMNRKASKSFPNTLKGVIYQKYQFGPVRNGSLATALSRYDAGKFTSSYHKDCIKAAKVALEGAKKVTYKGKEINMKNILYFSGKVSGAKFSIGNHQFK